MFVDDDNVLEEGTWRRSPEYSGRTLHWGSSEGRSPPSTRRRCLSGPASSKGCSRSGRYDVDTYRETTDVPYREYFPVGAGFAVRRGLGLAYLEDCAKTGWIQGRRGAELSAGEDTDLGLFVLYQGSKLAVTGSCA